MARARLLLTRPIADSEPLAMRLEALGFECITEPLLTLHYDKIPDLESDLDGVQALLFTSANGVRAFAQNTKRRDLPCYTVGKATLDCAHTVGFLQAEAAGGDVERLSALVQDRLSPEDGALFQAAGTKLAGDLKGNLEKAGFQFLRRPLYEARTAQALSHGTCTLFKNNAIDGVLLFSPRTAKTFAKLIKNASLSHLKDRFVLVGLSPAVCEAAFSVNPQLEDIHTLVAQHPDTDHLIDCLDQYF